MIIINITFFIFRPQYLTLGHPYAHTAVGMPLIAPHPTHLTAAHATATQTPQYFDYNQLMAASLANSYPAAYPTAAAATIDPYGVGAATAVSAGTTASSGNIVALVLPGVVMCEGTTEKS